MTFMDLDHTALDKALTEVHFSYGANLAEGPARRLIETYLAATALSQAEGAQKPVAWITKVGLKNWQAGALDSADPESHVLLRTGSDMRVPLYTLPREQEGAEPVAWDLGDTYGDAFRFTTRERYAASQLAEGHQAEPLYAHPSAASFQAGAEAMREAAAKVAEANIPYHYVSNDSGEWKDWQPGSPYDRGQLYRALEIAKAIRKLPIPASSEGR